MVRRSVCASIICLVAAGCGPRAPLPLDIVDAGPPRSSFVGGPVGPGQVPIEVSVRGPQLAEVLGNRARIDLALVDCGAPDQPRAQAPLTLGGEPVNDLSANQVESDDPDMQVLLGAVVPQDAIATPRPCARMVAPDGSGAEIISQPVPLRR